MTFADFLDKHLMACACALVFCVYAIADAIESRRR